MKHRPRTWSDEEVAVARELAATGATAGKGMHLLATAMAEFWRLSALHDIKWKGNPHEPGRDPPRGPMPAALAHAKRALEREIAAAKAEAPNVRPFECGAEG